MKDLAKNDYQSVLDQSDPETLDKRMHDRGFWKLMRILFNANPHDGTGKTNLARSYAYSKLGDKELAARELEKAQKSGGSKNDLLKEFTEQTGINLNF